MLHIANYKKNCYQLIGGQKMTTWTRQREAAPWIGDEENISSIEDQQPLISIRGGESS